MADINHEIKINASPQAVYNALTTASGLSNWHTAKTEPVEGRGETYAMRPQGGPDFEWKIVKVDSQTVEWQCVRGPGHSVGTIARFEFSGLEDGSTLLEFSHSGWPDTSGNFRKCNTLWGVLLFHLRKYLKTHEADPAFD
jgi:uncharacterized protein YndB with AHSA1/START domain